MNSGFTGQTVSETCVSAILIHRFQYTAEGDCAEVACIHSVSMIRTSANWDMATARFRGGQRGCSPGLPLFQSDIGCCSTKLVPGICDPV